MSSNKAIKNIVIVGGGTSGWMAATALSSQLANLTKVTLIESEQIGTIGVGESTIPPLRAFHQTLKINEAEFMRETSATFKMGVWFEGWGKQDSSYIHSFGNTGQESWLAGFQNLWLQAKERGIASEFGDYCFELVAAKQEKFALLQNSPIHYAYHLDANKYAKYLRSKCINQINHIEGTVTGVSQNPDSGFIETVLLDSGEAVSGDLFIDCTGFQGLLIEKTLNTGYENWGHWLPCDRAIAAQTKSTGPAVPYTKAFAHSAGWRWRIPLQTRIGNGFVYSSKHMSDDEALQTFLRDIDGQAINEPKLISYTTGRRLKAWNKNCIAMGLASGFVEPLESTGIHLFMTGITRLLQLFPFGGIVPSLVREYNNQTQNEFEKIRDFIILHYHLNQRGKEQFWRLCQSMDIPQNLQDKIELFQESATVFKEEGDPFRLESWTQVMLGQGLTPKAYHQVAKNIPDQNLSAYLNGLQMQIAERVKALPQHQEFINHYCKDSSTA